MTFWTYSIYFANKCFSLNLPPAVCFNDVRDAEGLIFYRCVFFLSFFFFFSTHNLLGHGTDLNQTWTHIHLWLLFQKLVPGHLPPRAGGIKRFLRPTLNFARTYLCNGTWYQQSEINLSIYRDSPTWLQIWWTLIQKRRLRTIGEFLPSPLISVLGHTASLTAWTLYKRQQANFGTCYVVARAYSLEQQNAGRAHAELCHEMACILLV